MLSAAASGWFDGTAARKPAPDTQQLARALAYARRGWPVFPCVSGDKRPDGRLAPHGLKDATRDEATIVRWWTAEPAANIGIDAGRAGLFVVDVDAQHDGLTAWGALTATHGEPETATVLTPSGGRHYYFTAPEGLEIRNSTSKIAGGIDVKASGGYVLAAGSTLPHGAYQWGGSSVVSTAPAWVLELVTEKPKAAPDGPTPKGDRVGEGRRNAFLAHRAGLLRQHGFSTDVIFAALSRENLERCEPALDDREVRRIAESIGRYQPATEGTREQQQPALEFIAFSDLAREVDSAGPRRWLIRGLWPSVDYGVHAAEMKGQKTWNATDLAVSVASGTKWLGHIPVDDRGPVLMFVGEGGKQNIVRRVRAVAEEHGVVPETLPLTICARAPHMSNPRHLAEMAAQLKAQRPRLAVLDPLYLSARGANLADLYAMGEMLEDAQRLCQQHGAALLVVTHFNRKQGTGAGRITGAGPAEWGRVLLSATIKSRHTDPETKATTVITEIDAIGGEIPDQTFRVRRRVWADDPDDLNSPLHLETTVTDGVDDTAPEARQSGLTPAAAKLLEALRAIAPATNAQLVDWVAAKHGHGLKRETVSRAMGLLADLGHARPASEIGPFKTTTWLLAEGDHAPM